MFVLRPSDVVQSATLAAVATARPTLGAGWVRGDRDATAGWRILSICVLGAHTNTFCRSIFVILSLFVTQ